MADPKLRIELDAGEAINGLDELRRMLDEMGGRSSSATAARGGSGSAPPAPGGKSPDERAAEAVSRSFRDLVIGQITGNISSNVAQAFNPLKTAMQQNEMLFRAGAEAAGTLGGAAAGFMSNPDPTTRNASVALGAQMGGAVGRVAAEGLLQIPDVARERYVNEQVSAALQQEGRARSSVGQSFSKAEADEMGRALAKAFRLEWENMRAATQGADAATGHLPFGGPGSGQEAASKANQWMRDAAANMPGGLGGLAPLGQLFGRSDG